MTEIDQVRACGLAGAPLTVGPRRRKAIRRGRSRCWCRSRPARARYRGAPAGAAVSETMGQPFVVENRTGANGVVAGDAAAKADPDGYTLLLGADSMIAINPHVYARMPFDPLKDLLPIASVASNQFFLASIRACRRTRSRSSSRSRARPRRRCPTLRAATAASTSSASRC